MPEHCHMNAQTPSLFTHRQLKALPTMHIEIIPKDKVIFGKLIISRSVKLSNRILWLAKVHYSLHKARYLSIPAPQEYSRHSSIPSLLEQYISQMSMHSSQNKRAKIYTNC